MRCNKRRDLLGSGYQEHLPITFQQIKLSQIFGIFIMIHTFIHMRYGVGIILGYLANAIKIGAELVCPVWLW